MLIGHYMTALVPYSAEKAAGNDHSPLILFLVAAQLPDLFLVAFGLFVEAGTLLNPAAPAMIYSHDLIPIWVIAIIMAVAGWLITRNRRVALWSGGLVLLHAFSDAISGFEHFVFGADTPSYGFNFYQTAPVTAFVIEAIFSFVFIAGYVYLEKHQERQVSWRKQGALYALTVVMIGVIAGSFNISL